MQELKTCETEMSSTRTFTLLQHTLSGGGEMGELLRTFDWSKTSLGSLDKWPQSLITAVSIILNSQHPMFVAWGEQQIFIYNDAYIQILSASKHPWALGRPFSQVWAEIWDICGPLTEKVFNKGEATFVNNLRLFMKRVDYLEEGYYSFSYSAIRDESGNVTGLFCPSASVTEKLLNERRLKTLAELSSKAYLEKTIDLSCASVIQTLAKNPADIPFALLYLVKSENRRILLTQSTGVSKDIPFISPSLIEFDNQPKNSILWPLMEVLKSGRAQVISVAGESSLPLGLADQSILQAIVLPLILPGNDTPLGILITGINPCRKLDDEYRTFYDLVAHQVATAIQNAKSYEEEKKRAEMLAELDKAKTVFFSNASHEFRTP